MKFNIPFTIAGIEKLKLNSAFLIPFIKFKDNTKLGQQLDNANINITREEYLAICLRSVILMFTISFFIFTTILIFLRVPFSMLFGLMGAGVFSGFILFNQRIYPSLYVQRRQRDIEKNLLSALQDILVQLDAGIPLFGVLVNISSADYGELSIEFKKAVRKISAGSPEQDVLEEISKNNPSLYFRRTLWQICNGMNAGSDMAIVIRDNIKALTEEQLIQIQNYGNRLNPLIVFYMLMAIIIPSLSITFLTIIASMIGLSKETSIGLFIALFVFVFLAQIMFMGTIKSRRPSLL